MLFTNIWSGAKKNTWETKAETIAITGQSRRLIMSVCSGSLGPEVIIRCFGTSLSELTFWLCGSWEYTPVCPQWSPASTIVSPRRSQRRATALPMILKRRRRRSWSRIFSDAATCRGSFGTDLSVGTASSSILPGARGPQAVLLSLRTDAASDGSPPTSGNNSGHVSPSALRSSPVVAGGSSRTSSRSAAAIPAVATGSPG